MSIFVIEFQAIPMTNPWYGDKHQHIEVIRDTLEEAIEEIEIEKEWGDGFVDLDKVIFDGPVSGNGQRRYLFTWEKKRKDGDKYQYSYIVRELEKSPEVEEAISRNEFYRLLEP